ncbi:tetratricopeptide repeat protein, partial [Enhygromyxa salina]|uniref:tetratricopeptide repeat protein n=1 Tax=Enhygromyxa salina TaxID=215803 RepID=UPI0011B1DD9A
MHTPGVTGVLHWLRTIPRRPYLRRRALVFVCVLALSFVPMAGTLGYFSSLLLAPLLSCLAAAAGVDAVLELRAAADTGGSPDERGPLWRLAAHGARELAWLVGLALGLLVVGMLWTTNCDPFGGAAYFVIGPMCSAALAWLAGVSAALLIGPRPRWVVLIAGWMPLLGSTLIGVHRLYFDPVVFAYDPFVGWFSGPIYDEGIEISSRYVLYRAYNGVAAAAVWLALGASLDERLRLSRSRMLAGGPNRLRSLVAVVLGLAALAIGWSAPRLGFTATTESLARVLAATKTTEHFVIRYAPTSITAREIEMVAAEHEFAWHRLERRLGSAPTRKIESFIFVSGDQRGALIGANKVEVSPPWRQQMYLSQRPWPHDVMHHELAHAFLGDFGDPVLGLPIAGLRFNGALVEGVPTALAPRAHDNLGLHEQAAVLDRLEKRPPLQAIMGAGFWGAAASRAYTAAGSFVLWLAQTHDWESVAELYGNAGDFEATYGVGLDALEQQWLGFLREIPLREADVEAQAQRYQRSSVFRRPCAHRAADLAHAAAVARVLGQEEEALDTQRTLCRIEPDEPGHFLRLADMLAGWEQFDQAAAVLDELAGREELTATVRAVIEEQRGDTALVAGRLDEAAIHYRAAIGLGLSEAGRRQLQIKLLGAGDVELAPLVVEFFGPFRVSDDSRASSMLQLWTAAKIAGLPGYAGIGDYLLGRQFASIAEPGRAAEVFERAVLGEGLVSVELQRAALLGLVASLTQLKEWERARGVLG